MVMIEISIQSHQITINASVITKSTLGTAAMQQMWVYFYEQNFPVYDPSFFSTVPLSIFQKVIIRDG